MRKRSGTVVLGIVVLGFFLPGTLAAESLYATSAGHLVRANLDGSGLEVVTLHPNPHCHYLDLAIHTSGAPYIAYECTTPIENGIIRLTSDLQWEDLLRDYSVGPVFLGIELSNWFILDVLYYTKFDEIRLMTLDRSLDLQLVPGGSEFIVGLDVDSTNDKIYWVQVPRRPGVVDGRIMRAGRVQPRDSVETFVSLVASTPNDVTVDEEGGMVYWSNVTTGTIQRAPVTDGQQVETVLQGLVDPTGIAVHPASGKLYWAEGYRVRRSNLDGTVIEDILNLPYQPYRLGFGPDAFVGVEVKAWGQVKLLYR